MEVKILGICGSPIKGGNVELFLTEALKTAEKMDNVRTEMITLAGKEIRDCLHCNWCLSKQEEGKFCAQKDDMVQIYPKVLEADGLLLASPVYIGRLSGYLACFIDRLRAFQFNTNYYKSVLLGKVGGALAVVWFHHSGAEPTLISIMWGFLHLGMIPVGAGPRCPMGAAAVSSEGGTGKVDFKDTHKVLKDEYGLVMARTLAKRVVKLAKTLKAGEEVLKAKVWEDVPY